ncbi:hypothetical protein DLH72_03310 [Candidatus Gracilibacteria bacterium]|nr:MAG: hypothetical protein DLH72_03310 [Candidatus Gracilibacteria bacterium]
MFSIFSIFQEYESITPENRKEIITRLKQALSPQVLTNIVKDLGVNTKEYRDFKNSLISIEGGEGGYFRSQFDMIEHVGAHKAKEFASLGVDKNPVRTDEEGNLTYEDGEKLVKVDVNGNRTLALAGSKYDLVSDIDEQKSIEKIDRIEKGLQDEILPINNEISALLSLENILKENENLDFSELKDYIIKNFEGKIDTSKIKSMSSKEDILKYIQVQLYSLETEKKSKIKKKTEEIKLVLQENAKNAEQIDEEKKKILEFLSDIGFDLIPKEATDSIINMINSSADFMSKLGFNSKINISKGQLGISKNREKLSLEDKRKFIKFFNKMLSGQEDIPNFMGNDLKIKFFTSKENMEKGKSDIGEKRNYINSKLGTNPKETMFSNLKLS